jgi:hypothetical protein
MCTAKIETCTGSVAETTVGNSGNVNGRHCGARSIAGKKRSAGGITTGATIAGTITAKLGVPLISQSPCSL